MNDLKKEHMWMFLNISLNLKKCLSLVNFIGENWEFW
jgi:hypothetical protein